MEIYLKTITRRLEVLLLYSKTCFNLKNCHIDQARIQDFTLGGALVQVSAFLGIRGANPPEAHRNYEN